MAAGEFGVNRRTRLLVDSNLLVLLVVGRVNPDRIARFKRTCQFSRQDYDLLRAFVSSFESLYTLTHIMAEVSNLCDLTGQERLLARRVMTEMLCRLNEPSIPSRQAAEEVGFIKLGLTDAAIIAASREHKCSVLTSDFALYQTLWRAGLPAINFAHLQEAAGTI
jgi:rRNA-processing protein FCF1